MSVYRYFDIAFVNKLNKKWYKNLIDPQLCEFTRRGKEVPRQNVQRPQLPHRAPTDPNIRVVRG